MKKQTYELSYPGATVAQVRALLWDKAFREAVCQAQKVVSHDVDVTASETSARIRVEQVQATTGMPTFAKKFVGEQTTVVTEEHWDSPTTADLTVAIPGKPGEMDGSLRLTEDAAGTTETIDLDINVAIPFLGGKVEEMLADLMAKAYRKEQQVGRTWLAGQTG